MLFWPSTCTLASLAWSLSLKSAVTMSPSVSGGLKYWYVALMGRSPAGLHCKLGRGHDGVIMYSIHFGSSVNVMQDLHDVCC